MATALAPGVSQAIGAAGLTLATSPAASAHSGVPASGSSVVLAFIPGGERVLAAEPEMSVGLMSATQGAYSREQFLLDLGQGARISSSAYPTADPPPLLHEYSDERRAHGSTPGWTAVLERAEDAPQLLRPGLLGSSIPGGAGYVAAATDNFDSIVAFDRQGRLSASSSGSPQTLLRRIAAMRARKRLVVSDLPAGKPGLADLRALSKARARGELLLVVQRASGKRGHQLLWAAGAGLPGGGGRELASHTTNQRGLIATVDLAPTILDYLGLSVPSDMRGERVETSGALHGASLRSLKQRLQVVGGRRLKALGCLLAAWALLLLAAAFAPRARRRAACACALRVGGLAVLWAPVAVLLSAALEPGAAVEYAAIVFACLLLATVTDALLPWPRAPLAPAVVSILALVLDALAGTQLLMRSLLGPNPILGARFYGFGNELKSGLAVLVLAAIAAAAYPAIRSRRLAAAAAVLGALLAAIEGAARLGAGVGGAILVAAGFAVAAVMLLPGQVSRRRVLLVLASPLVALVALALIDLATAHGSGHFTGSILHARSAGDLRDVIVRRYTAAWKELENHAMPVATALALLYAILGVRLRERLLAPVGADPAWLAALGGGLTAGVIGMLVEDSGPVLLVVAVFALGCVCSYLWGRPTTSAVPRRAARPASTPEA